MHGDFLCVSKIARAVSSSLVGEHTILEFGAFCQVTGGVRWGSYSSSKFYKIDIYKRTSI
jgi:hypothetical protein